MSTTATPGTLLERIQKLAPRLKKVAYMFCSDEMEMDEIFSEMVLAILEKCKPTDTDSFIVTKAKWTAFNHVNKERIYTKYITNESDLNESNRPDGDEFEFYEINDGHTIIFSGSYSESPEDLLVEHESKLEQDANQKIMQEKISAALAGLHPATQVIACLLMEGLRPVDIAKKRGTSESSVSQCIKKISKSLVTVNITING